MTLAEPDECTVQGCRHRRAVLVLVGCRYCDLQLLGSRASLPRLAQGVLSREEPEESFLKGVPSEPDSLELIFPVSPPTITPRLNFAWLW